MVKEAIYAKSYFDIIVWEKSSGVFHLPVMVR
jgi:hypothetical protein